jgi:hypothetical protein
MPTKYKMQREPRWLKNGLLTNCAKGVKCVQDELLSQALQPSWNSIALLSSLGAPMHLSEPWRLKGAARRKRGELKLTAKQNQRQCNQIQRVHPNIQRSSVNSASLIQVICASKMHTASLIQVSLGAESKLSCPKNRQQD